VMHDRGPAQRLLVLGVLASTNQLVRGLADGVPQSQLLELLRERRRMLGELDAVIDGAGFAGRMHALSAAVAESDRTVEALIA
jgi:hypothetical protein